MWQRVFSILIVALGVFFAAVPFRAVPTANAQAQPFYQGKTIRIVVGLCPEVFMTAGRACLPAICRKIFRAIRR